VLAQTAGLDVAPHIPLEMVYVGLSVLAGVDVMPCVASGAVVAPPLAAASASATARESRRPVEACGLPQKMLQLQ
jgi:hypothetical protein